MYLQDGVRHGGEEPLSLQDENVPQAEGQRERRLQTHKHIRSPFRFVNASGFYISAAPPPPPGRRFVWFFPRPQRPAGPSELNASAGQRSADSG